MTTPRTARRRCKLCPAVQLTHRSHRPSSPDLPVLPRPPWPAVMAPAACLLGLWWCKWWCKCSVQGWRAGSGLAGMATGSGLAAGCLATTSAQHHLRPRPVQVSQLADEQLGTLRRAPCLDRLLRTANPSAVRNTHLPRWSSPSVTPCPLRRCSQGRRCGRCTCGSASSGPVGATGT